MQLSKIKISAMVKKIWIVVIFPRGKINKLDGLYGIISSKYLLSRQKYVKGQHRDRQEKGTQFIYGSHLGPLMLCLLHP